MELDKKPFKNMWKCNRETIMSGEILALNPVRGSPKKQEMGPKVKCFQEAEYQGLCQEMATTSFPGSPVVKTLCPQCRCEGS